MTDATTDTPQQPPTPNPDLRGLDRLVGTWNVSGGAQGQVTYEWMEGGFFLIQHVELEQYGQKSKGIEIIGHERQFGAEPSADIKSRFHDNLGNTLDYVYELEGDTLTIWAARRARRPTTRVTSARTATPSPAPGPIRAAAATSRPPPGSSSPNARPTVPFDPRLLKGQPRAQKPCSQPVRWAGGVEPPSSSVSANSGEALC